MNLPSVNAHAHTRTHTHTQKAAKHKILNFGQHFLRPFYTQDLLLWPTPLLFNARWKTIPVVFLRCPISAVHKQAHWPTQEAQCRYSIAASKAQSTQDAGRHACVNSNIFPLILLACSVDTPIHINRSYLLASHCQSHPASCVDWALV